LNPLLKPKGFTLLEVLVALIILCFALLALAGLMVTTTKNNAVGNYVTETATFAQDKLEELRAVKSENLIDGNNTDQQGGSTGTNYTRNWNVKISHSLKKITIDVNWNDRTTHSINLVSVLSQ